MKWPQTRKPSQHYANNVTAPWLPLIPNRLCVSCIAQHGPVQEDPRPGAESNEGRRPGHVRGARGRARWWLHTHPKGKVTTRSQNYKRRPQIPVSQTLKVASRSTKLSIVTGGGADTTLTLGLCASSPSQHARYSRYTCRRTYATHRFHSFVKVPKPLNSSTRSAFERNDLFQDLVNSRNDAP